MNSNKIIKGEHYVTSGFGWRTIKGKRSFHYGTDYGTNGQSIPCYAYKSGVVIQTGYDRKGAGNFVKIEHIFQGQRYIGVYFHLRTINVFKGQAVDNNTIVGYIGTTGNSSGIHLHFGWYNNSYANANAVDFEKWEEPKEVAPIEQYGIVINCAELNVRKGPGINFPYANFPENSNRHTIKRGTKIKIGGKSGVWYNIYYGNNGGWVHSHYIRLI